jgi:single-stranded-DNA-specific exonuclease
LEDWWEGSSRGYDKSELKSFKDFLQNSGIIEYAQGHANAFGAGVRDTRFTELVEYCNTALADYDFSPHYNVDFIYNNNFDANNILKIANYDSLWGQGVEEPKVVIENLNVYKGNLRLMSPDSRPTLKITLPNGVTLLKFGSSSEEYEALYSELGCVTINVIGRCECNVWNGIISPQLNIIDYEIVGRTDYYF